MRKAAVLLMAVLMPLSLVAVSASARPAAPRAMAPALVPVAEDALTEALDEGQISAAEYALERARSLSRLRAVREDFGAVLPADPRSATLILRDLALRLDSLSGEERQAGVAMLQRPTQGGTNDNILEYNTAEATPVDSTNFRIHYVTSGAHASTPADVAAVSAIMEEVWTKEVTLMGWRAPKADGGLGGNNKFDVYLGDIGDEGYYGYCSTDPGQSTRDQTSYCVLDEDFDEFPLPPVDSRKVTAAHEFHHALQYAYDVTDDYWMLEATATWMEDEVYDSINDNYQYLSGGPLGRPQTPADTWVDFSDPSNPDTGYQYGTFIWLRYLSEKAADPAIIRSIWEKTAEAGVYSLEAIESVLGGETSFVSSFSEFAARNAKASLFYEEGAAYEAQVAPQRQATHNLAAGGVPVVNTVTNADHLTTRYISFTPGSGIGATEQIALAVNMGIRPGQKAMVVNIAGSSMNVQEIPLVNGRGELAVPFGGQTEVVLVLVNASNRMNNCTRWSPGKYSCGGTPADEDQAYTYSGTVGVTATDPGEPGAGGGDTVAPQLSGLTVRPNPVVAGRTAKILFNIDEAATLKVLVLQSGRRVVSGTVNIPSAGGYFVPWNVSRKMAAGLYTVKLTATDAAGNRRSAKTTVRVKR